MFQIYIMMNLFNMINCRVVDKTPQAVPEDEDLTEEERAEIIAANKPQFNIFTRFWSNQWFWIVFFFELNVQFLIVGYRGTGLFFGTTPLNFSMHLTALLLGLGSMAVCAIVKLMGPKTIHMMPELGEDAEALEKAQNFSDSANNALTFINVEEEDDDDKNNALNRSHSSSDQEVYEAPKIDPEDEAGLPAEE